MTTWRQLDLLKHPRRQRGTRPPPALERRTHIALVDTLRIGLADGWWFSHVPNGELRTERTGAVLKRMGAKPGVFDLMLISPTGLVYFMELKRGRAPLTLAQKVFLAEMDKRGVPCAVARSYDEALDRLSQWGAIRVRVAA
jgi:hypothetical protein